MSRSRSRRERATSCACSWDVCVCCNSGVYASAYVARRTRHTDTRQRVGCIVWRQSAMQSAAGESYIYRFPQSRRGTGYVRAQRGTRQSSQAALTSVSLRGGVRSRPSRFKAWSGAYGFHGFHGFHGKKRLVFYPPNTIERWPTRWRHALTAYRRRPRRRRVVHASTSWCSQPPAR